MLTQLKRYELSLARFKDKSRARELSHAQGIEFSTNDYLALAHSSQLKEAVQDALERGVGVGAGSSRLISGHLSEHEQLEALAAKFFKCEKALYFSSGYMANLALFRTLPGRGDHIFYDEYVHASILDGIVASKASATAFRHNDMQDLTDKITAWRAAHATGIPWVAVESIYSMEGDFAPLNEMLTLVRECSGLMIIDEAHATGVYGVHGEGLAPAASEIISVHTCGKALGAAGALVATNSIIHDYLINHARTFIYTTAASPLMAVAVQAALEFCLTNRDKRDELTNLMTYANDQLATRFNLAKTNSQIIPIILKTNPRVMQVSSSLQDLGFHIRAIRAPTVPEGTARLRLSISRHVRANQIDALFDALKQILEK